MMLMGEYSKAGVPVEKIQSIITQLLSVRVFVNARNDKQFVFISKEDARELRFKSEFSTIFCAFLLTGVPKTYLPEASTKRISGVEVRCA